MSGHHEANVAISDSESDPAHIIMSSRSVISIKEDRGMLTIIQSITSVFISEL